MKRHSTLFILFIVMSLILSGCGRRESFYDLRDYLKKSDQASGQAIPKEIALPKPPVPAIYQKNIARSPFEEAVQSGASMAGAAINPILRYPLNLLRFVGVVTQENKIWAYIVTPDNKLYQVTIGDIIGESHGKVIDIKPYEIKITEPTEGEKPGTERIVTLHLKEELNNAKN